MDMPPHALSIEEIVHRYPNQVIASPAGGGMAECCLSPVSSTPPSRAALDLLAALPPKISCFHRKSLLRLSWPSLKRHLCRRFLKSRPSCLTVSLWALVGALQPAIPHILMSPAMQSCHTRAALVRAARPSRALGADQGERQTTYLSFQMAKNYISV